MGLLHPVHSGETSKQICGGHFTLGHKMEAVGSHQEVNMRYHRHVPHVVLLFYSFPLVFGSYNMRYEYFVRELMCLQIELRFPTGKICAAGRMMTAIKAVTGEAVSSVFLSGDSSE